MTIKHIFTKKINALTLAPMMILSACGDISQNTSLDQEESPFPQVLQSGIVGGSEVQQNNFLTKGIVSLVYKQDGVWSSYCTGSLLSANQVLTAGHCKTPEDIEVGVAFGNNMLQLKDKDVFHTVDFIRHKDYVEIEELLENQAAYDIAVLSFDGVAPKGYRAVSFLADSSLLQNGRTVTLAGYGLTHGDMEQSGGVLRKVSVPVLDKAFNGSEVLLDQSMRRGGCYGDSGGPAYVYEKGRYFLFGVTSRGPHPCVTESVYTNAVYHKEWVQKTRVSLK